MKSSSLKFRSHIFKSKLPLVIYIAFIFYLISFQGFCDIGVDDPKIHSFAIDKDGNLLNDNAPVYRGDTIQIVHKITSQKDDIENIKIRIRVPWYYNVMDENVSKANTTEGDTILNFNQENLKKNSHYDFSYYVKISKNMKTPEIEYLPIIKRRNVEYDGMKVTFDDDDIVTNRIRIQNNPPKIVNVSFSPMENSHNYTLYKDDKIAIDFKATDVEDDEKNLTYTIYDYCQSCEKDGGNSIDEINLPYGQRDFALENFTLENLPEDEPRDHLFKLKVTDSDGGSTGPVGNDSKIFTILKITRNDFENQITTAAEQEIKKSIDKYHDDAIDNLKILWLSLIALAIIIALIGTIRRRIYALGLNKYLKDEKYYKMSDIFMLIASAVYLILAYIFSDYTHISQILLFLFVGFISTILFIKNKNKLIGYAIWSVLFSILFSLIYILLPEILDMPSVPLQGLSGELVLPAVISVVLFGFIAIFFRPKESSENIVSYLFRILLLLTVVYALIAVWVGVVIFKQQFEPLELLAIILMEFIFLLAVTYIFLSLNQQADKS